MFICLVEKTIAFGGVDIGIMKAQLAAKTTGKIIFTISKPESMAKVPSKGNNKKVVQCGYCTSGIIVSLTDLFNKNKLPERNEIVDTLSGQLCRCGSHASVLKAVNNVIKNRKYND